jgi:hypothetical protein
MGLPASKEYEMGVPTGRTGSADLAEITGGRKVEARRPYHARIGDLVCATGASVGRLCGGTKVRARIYYAEAVATAQRLATRARERARYFKQERPLQALGMIAAGAFVCGIALRIWRSRNS